MDNDEVIYSDNYTRVVVYQSRSFTIGDISLAVIGGIQWNAALPALVRSLLIASPFAVLLPLLGHSLLWALWAILIPPVPAAVIYWRLAKERQGGLSEPQRRKLRRNHRSQPRHLLGLAQDTEPTSFNWQLILFEPPVSQRDSHLFSRPYRRLRSTPA